MAGMNTTTFSAAIHTQYEKRLLTRAQPRMLHAKWATEAHLSKANQYECRKYGSLPLVTTTLAEGVTPGEQDAPALTTVVLAPAWYGAWLYYTEKLELEVFDPIVSETSGILGEQAGLSFDTLCRNNITDGATKQYSGAATDRSGLDTTNDKITYADFIEAVATLKINNAMPADGSLFPVLMHPYSWAQLMQDTTFVALFTRSTPEVMKTGNMGQILDCSIYVSSNARTYTGTPNVHSMLFIGRESYATAGMTGVEANLVNDPGGEYANNTGRSVSPVQIIAKGLGETGFDPLNQRGTLGWKATYDDAILNSAWILDLENVTAYD